MDAERGEGLGEQISRNIEWFAAQSLRNRKETLLTEFGHRLCGDLVVLTGPNLGCAKFKTRVSECFE